MKTYLLAAEVDKIQDIIFRAIRLPEIVGGSQLLTNWCKEIEWALIKYGVKEENIIVANGGAFRIIFDNKEDCVLWKEEIAESYYQKFGGTISIIEPIEMNDTIAFNLYSKEAQKKLRQMKNNPQNQSACIHTPYANYCEVCSIGIATIYNKTDDKRSLVCESCNQKITRNNKKHEEIVDQLITGIEHNLNKNIKIERPKSIDDIGELDKKRQIAYFVADGNNMGVIFDKCKKEEMKILSNNLSQIVIDSMIEVTSNLINIICQDEKEINKKEVTKITLPVLPLVIGGDDVCLLVIAEYSIDFTRLFVGKYLEKITSLLEKLEITEQPSISCGLYITKAKNPHTLAYNEAEKNMTNAKRVSKDNGGNMSLIDIGAGIEKRTEDLLNSMSPFLVGKRIDEDIISVQDLLDARKKLNDIPLSQLYNILEIFIEILNKDCISDLEVSEKTFFINKLNRQIDRVGRSEKDKKILVEVLQLLGSKDDLFLKKQNLLKSLKEYYGTSFIDLMEFWDYLTVIREGKEGEKDEC